MDIQVIDLGVRFISTRPDPAKKVVVRENRKARRTRAARARRKAG